MKEIIDSHIHVWEFERAGNPRLKEDTTILNRTWRIEELDEVFFNNANQFYKLGLD